MKQDGVGRMGDSGEPGRQERRFLRYAADRLKNPVTVIGLALQGMEEVQSEKERREYLEMAKRGQRELSQAVEDVLDAAREGANTRRDWK